MFGANNVADYVMVTDSVEPSYFKEPRTDRTRNGIKAIRQPDRFVPDANNVVDFVMVTNCDESLASKKQ